MRVMEQRKVKIQFAKSGGTASANSVTNRITLPTTWIKEMGITKEDREVKIYLSEDKKIIIEKDS